MLFIIQYAAVIKEILVVFFTNVTLQTQLKLSLCHRDVKYHLKLAFGLKSIAPYKILQLTTEESRLVYSVIPQRMDVNYLYFTRSINTTLLQTWYRVSTGPMDNIIGFTRDTFVEITTNIESQEERRLQNTELGYPEHPRAATTDDVECFLV
ncbi:Hypothetical predicted protein [Mytilus galloprovincialis]|uniref:Uncharacterized protein n=1 Tax=Mytilus galloprovincialis TaxID=29158 RepID=A0A8B6DTF4_MYTGA|nr:Hypothetical predicted protein [Mytilus galloprovincialis]